MVLRCSPELEERAVTAVLRLLHRVRGEWSSSLEDDVAEWLRLGRQHDLNVAGDNCRVEMSVTDAEAAPQSSRVLEAIIYRVTKKRIVEINIQRMSATLGVLTNRTYQVARGNGEIFSLENEVNRSIADTLLNIQIAPSPFGNESISFSYRNARDVERYAEILRTLL